jgi:hypothetical protein
MFRNFGNFGNFRNFSNFSNEDTIMATMPLARKIVAVNSSHKMLQLKIIFPKFCVEFRNI